MGGNSKINRDCTNLAVLASCSVKRGGLKPSFHCTSLNIVTDHAQHTHCALALSPGNFGGPISKKTRDNMQIVTSQLRYSFSIHKISARACSVGKINACFS